MYIGGVDMFVDKLGKVLRSEHSHKHRTTPSVHTAQCHHITNVCCTLHAFPHYLCGQITETYLHSVCVANNCKSGQYRITDHNISGRLYRKITTESHHDFSGLVVLDLMVKFGYVNIRSWGRICRDRETSLWFMS